MEDAIIPGLQRTNEIRSVKLYFSALVNPLILDYADIKNAGKGTGGSCTAAIFLKVLPGPPNWSIE